MKNVVIKFARLQENAYLCTRKINTALIKQCRTSLTKAWRVRISVSTQDFHSCKRGSTPLRATKQKIIHHRAVMR